MHEKGFLDRTAACLGQGLCILVGSDATVPMQCHARSCIVECPMWESICTLSDTDDVRPERLMNNENIYSLTLNIDAAKDGCAQ